MLREVAGDVWRARDRLVVSSVDARRSAVRDQVDCSRSLILQRNRSTGVNQGKAARRSLNYQRAAESRVVRVEAGGAATKYHDSAAWGNDGAGSKLMTKNIGTGATGEKTIATDVDVASGGIH